jgi:peptidoglycan/xylan/chitin deacetylase (PgdA/CDA1 family)
VRRSVGRDTWARLTHAPVILMYHALGRDGVPPSRHVLPRRRFARQMAWLRSRGYPVIRMSDFVADRTAGRLPPARSVIITFDDGYRDNCDLALPVLARNGFPAMIFLVTGAVGGVNHWDHAGDLTGRPILSRRDIQDMVAAGIEFGGHTRNHVSLTETGADRTQEEISGSLTELADYTGQPAWPVFAYPHGRFNPAVAAAVEQAGFSAACCSLGGTNEPAIPAFALRRVEIKGTDSLLRFAIAAHLGMRLSPLALLRRLLLGG